jgi:hypothetical protein
VKFFTITLAAVETLKLTFHDNRSSFFAMVFTIPSNESPARLWRRCSGRENPVAHRVL